MDLRNAEATEAISTNQTIAEIHEKEELKEHQESGTCFNSFCAGCFGTRQLTLHQNRENYVRATLVELTIYLVYLIVCCIVVLGKISSTDYYYTKVLSDLFLDTPFDEETRTTFRISANVKDFWKFTDTAMLNGLYWEEWYDDPDISKPVPPQDQGILYENRILGFARLRQIRVVNEVCPVAQVFRTLSAGKNCYPHYSTKNEDKGPYSSTLHNTAWTYHSEKELNGTSYWGKLTTYDGSGTYLLLAPRREETKELIAELKQNLWITRATRVVFLEFTVYNANINMFCIVRLAWEFPATGGLVTSWSLRSVRFIRYVNEWDYFILACEVIFIAFTVYYTIQELIEMCGLGIKDYLSDVWSYLDLLLLTISYICIGFSFYKLALVAETMESYLSNPDQFADFEILAFRESQFNNGIAILLFFSWVKIFKYISFNRTMSQLSTTLSRCAKDIAGFSMMFFIVFFAFSQLGYLLFGSQVRDFSTFQDSVFTLLQLILGDFDFREIEAANRILGPIFFLSYVFFVFFVLINMFLAIINDTYSEVKSEIQAQRSEFQISDYIKQKFRCLGAAVGNGKSDDHGTKDTLDGKITPTELKNHLIQAKFTGSEVDLFLARYELDKDHTLDEEETEQVIAKLEGTHNENYEVHEAGDTKTDSAITENEIDLVDTRITAMEVSLTGLLRKMDNMISKLDEIDE